jgi:Matrixin
MKRARAKTRTEAETRSVVPLRPRETASHNPFQRRDSASKLRAEERYAHVYGDGVICETDTRGYATPDNKSPTEIVLDASSGFIPLWAKGTTLRWRFQEQSMTFFEDSGAAKRAISNILGEAILAWGDAAPIKFDQTDSNWDFEIKMRAQEACDARGCVLASAFFPDAGRHELEIYPTMLDRDSSKQINTLIHEIGHVFGLRHFFAQISETGIPSEVFGIHRPISIMNYGPQSQLTADDKSDLKRLYQLAWSGQLTEINGTPIKLVKPFSVETGERVEVETAAAIGTSSRIGWLPLHSWGAR